MLRAEQTNAISALRPLGSQNASAAEAAGEMFVPGSDEAARANGHFGRLARRFSLLHSVPFRLMAALSAVYLICFGLAACIFYELLQERLLDRIDDSIIERRDAIVRVYERDGINAVIALAHNWDELPMRYAMGYHLATADGERVAGNVPTCITEPGWDILSGKDLGLDDGGYYRFHTMPLGNNLLSLGKSMYSLEELRTTALSAFLWTLFISLLLAMCGASYMAYRTHCRIQRIARSMNRVASGNLDARLPISSSQDDIDELATQINDALSRLQQMVESMHQVSTDIAHDLKTPLNRLFIQIEEAAELTRAGEQVDEQLMQALDEARNINATFEALLRIAQIEAGARRAQFCKIDLTAVLETAVEVYGAVVEEHDQKLEFLTDPCARLPMQGDRELILQLVVNLVENAIRHCPKGTRITISAGYTHQKVWFSVADNGPGVPHGETQNVMRRLYRLETSRTTEGTGLGLSLVKAVADLHCGKVLLEDNEPGLRVTVLFTKHCPQC